MKNKQKITSLAIKIYKFERLKMILYMIFDGKFNIIINDKLRKQLKDLQKYL